MDNFSVYGDSCDDWFTNLKRVLRRCWDKHLTLNKKNCHFMVKKRIV